MYLRAPIGKFQKLAALKSLTGNEIKEKKAEPEGGGEESG